MQTHSLYKTVTVNCDECGVEKPKSSTFRKDKQLICCKCMIKDLKFKQKPAKIFS